MRVGTRTTSGMLVFPGTSTQPRTPQPIINICWANEWVSHLMGHLSHVLGDLGYSLAWWREEDLWSVLSEFDRGKTNKRKQKKNYMILKVYLGVIISSSISVHPQLSLWDGSLGIRERALDLDNAGSNSSSAIPNWEVVIKHRVLPANHVYTQHPCRHSLHLTRRILPGLVRGPRLLSLPPFHSPVTSGFWLTKRMRHARFSFLSGQSQPWTVAPAESCIAVGQTHLIMALLLHL